MRLKKKEDAPKAGIIMLIVLVVIYIISLGLAVYMAAHGAFNEKESPFVTALDKYHFSLFPHVFNATIILAGFSTMTVLLFGVTTLLVTLADGGDAPALFSKKLKKFKSLPLPSLCLATIGLIASIVTALLLTGKIYKYITIAAGILILFNWSFIIISALRILKIKISCFTVLFSSTLIPIEEISKDLSKRGFQNNTSQFTACFLQNSASPRKATATNAFTVRDVHPIDRTAGRTEKPHQKK